MWLVLDSQRSSVCRDLRCCCQNGEVFHVVMANDKRLDGNQAGRMDATPGPCLSQAARNGTIGSLDCDLELLLADKVTNPMAVAWPRTMAISSCFFHNRPTRKISVQQGPAPSRCPGPTPHVKWKSHNAADGAISRNWEKADGGWEVRPLSPAAERSGDPGRASWHPAGVRGFSFSLKVNQY